MEVLHRQYGPLMELVRTLIGVVPNCDRYLEIWPPAFRSYNLIVPNLMNLPAAIFGLGGAPKALVGLSMLVASRSAECPYCTAHTCSFALRRGASAQTVAAALLGRGDLTPEEAAVVAVARSLGRVPCEITPSERQALEGFFPPQEAEWIAMGAVAMGFLNKFMDAIGVELESSTVAEVRETLGADWSPGAAGWSLGSEASASTPPPSADSWREKVGILQHLPAALWMDKRWQRGVPSRWPQAGDYLQRHTGHAFPVLGSLRNPRCLRAIATVLTLNLDPAECRVPRETKILAAAIFAAVIADDALAEDVTALARSHGVDRQRIDASRVFACAEELDPPSEDRQERALLLLARAASSSPARITLETVESSRQALLPPEAIIELVCWLSVLQLLHRLSAYHQAGGAA
jgi:alkylhydroperoxidase family enzyme